MSELLLGCIAVLRTTTTTTKSIYIAPFCTKVHTKRWGMDHTVLPTNNTMPAFRRCHLRRCGLLLQTE